MTCCLPSGSPANFVHPTVRVISVNVPLKSGDTFYIFTLNKLKSLMKKIQHNITVL